MEQKHIEELKNLCHLYGTYEVVKAIKNITVASSEEYLSLGNTGAIIHKDALQLKLACQNMAQSHPLRSKDVK